ncbi:fatty acid desaturase [Paraburkholderia sediminicola]|uniref:fatty acid desaturase n=1 Tax=Paraburkholderia sediminicola TaxID=458836 RepID=UPI000E735980
MSLTASSSVIADQTAMHSAVTLADTSWKIPLPSALRSLSDVVVDWAIIYFAVWGAYRIGAWITVLAILVVGNRQRALGNLLHEASHQNLSTQRNVNDWLANIFLSPALLNDLTVYRSQHARHHAWLGDPTHDPDYLPCVTRKGDRWFDAYARVLADPSIWAGSLFGHFSSKRLTRRQGFAIVLWWGICEALLQGIAGTHFALLFLALWIAAKATVFHAITTFREMNDHYGLESGGIFRHTRETPDLGPLSVLIHPHHNGYHLTHHLFPHIPYYHLPRAHEHLEQVPFFNRHSIVCDAYLKGSHASVEGWGTGHG